MPSPKGFRHSKETKARLSEISKNLWRDPEYRMKQLAIMKSSKYRNKMSEIITEVNEETEHRKKKSKSIKKLWQDEEYRTRQLEARDASPISGMKGKKHTTKTKGIISKKISEISRERWKDKDYRERVIKNMLTACSVKPNKPERFLLKLFRKLNLPFKFVGNGEVVIGRYCPDFINCNDRKQIIEFYGSYWHGVKVTGRTQTEEENLRKAHYAKYGYRTLVIWEDELEDISQLIEKITNFVDGGRSK